MTQLKPLRVPVPVIVLLSAMILACGSTQESSTYSYSDSSSSGSSYTPPTTTYTAPAPAGPTFPAYIPELDRSKPPDYPKTATVALQYGAPAKPATATFFQDLTSKWNVASYRGNAEPYVNESFQFGTTTAILVSEASITYNADGSSTRQAHGLAILTFDSAKRYSFSGATISTSDAYTLGFGYMRDGYMHGPWWFNNVEYARSGRSGGQVDYVGEYQNGKANGEFRWFDGGFLYQRAWYVDGSPNGTLTNWGDSSTFQKNMVNGTSYGLYQYWDGAGRLTYRSYLYGEKYYGKWESWSPAGDPPYQTGYRDLGAERGWRTAYDSDGRLMLQAWTVDNWDNGPYVRYAPEGYKQWEGTRVNGVHHGLFKRFTADGFNDFDSMYVDGAQTGPAHWYHANGRVWKEGTLVAGIENGRFTTYREDGTTSIVADYKDGKVHGEWIEYDSAGNIYAHDIYEGGVWVRSEMPIAWPEPPVMTDAAGKAIRRTYGRWRVQTQDDGPDAHYGMGMAWSEALGGCVLFGGASSKDGAQIFHPSTWLRKDGKWQHIFAFDAGPEARTNPAMAYDSARGVVVLFGGANAAGALGDTWELSSEGWRKLTPALSPAACTGARLAYDTQRGVCVLFGGLTSDGALNTTHEWNGTNWAAVSVDNPPTARHSHAMAYDEDRGVVVIQGGLTTGGAVSDTLTFDGKSWARPDFLKDGMGFGFHSMVYDSDARRMVLFARDTYGNVDFGFKAMVPEYGWVDADFEWTFVNERYGPPTRWAYAACYDRKTREIVVFGGWDEYDEPMRETLVLYDETADDLVADERDFIDKDLAAPGWTWIDNGAFAREQSYDPSIVHDSARGVTVMFGGDFFRSLSNETREFAEGKWSLKHPVNSPSARRGPICWFDETRGKVMIHAGSTPDAKGAPVLFSDLWEWDGSNWTRLLESVPGMPAEIASWAYDRKRGVVVALASPTAGVAPVLYEFNGSVWKAIEAGAPAVGIGSGQWVYDPAAEKCLRFGAYNNSTESWDERAWYWDGKYWQEAGFKIPAATGSGKFQWFNRQFEDPKRKALWTLSWTNSGSTISKLEGGKWTHWKAPPGLSTRNCLLWVDPRTGRIFVHGTRAQNTRNDTLEFDPEKGELND